MTAMNMESITTRQINYQVIKQDKEYKKSISEMRVVERFLEDFGFLSLDHDFILCGKHILSMQMITTSFELTCGSIISCCESGCIADAYSLLRKYRDDMFFYLYIVVYDKFNKLNHKSSSAVQMKTNIERWINNDLNDLHIGTILKSIDQSSHVKDAVQKYNLRSYFDVLGNRLNNYVHGNGISFYNRGINFYKKTDLQKQIDLLQKDMRSVTITFLFLLTLCSPHSIMSTDYVDYLEYNSDPPEKSQYWVAPFITDFFKRNIDLIDESCIKYLHDNTLMEFD